MVKKKSLTAAGSSTTGGAAAKSSSTLPKKSSADAPPPAPAPPVPPGSIAKPGDWLASSITKRDEKRAQSLGLVSSDEGNVILPGFLDNSPNSLALHVLEAKPKDSWKNLSPERAAADELFAKFLQSKEADGQTMIGTEVPIVSGNIHDSPNDTSEGRGSSVPVDFHTAEHIDPEDEHDDPIDSEAAHANPPSSADDACDTEGSVRDDDADRDAFIDAAVEEARASPAKRSTGGFADEDDLFDIDEGFVEAPTKKAKSGAAPPGVAASEASVPKAAPAAQVPTASSLSKGKDAPSTAAARTPPSDLRGVISSLEAFASQFTSLEAEKVQLQKEVKSSSLKLDGAVKIAAEAHQEIDSLKEELGKLREKLREEEATRLAAEARAAEKDELLRQSSLALLESSSALSEDDRIQHMKDRITQLEKDLRSTYALAAIIKKKGEIAADVERYALTELHKATESLNYASTEYQEEEVYFQEEEDHFDQYTNQGKLIFLQMEPMEPINTKFYQLGNGGSLIFEHDLNSLSDFLGRPHPEFHGIEVNDQPEEPVELIEGQDASYFERILFSFRESNRWTDSLVLFRKHLPVSCAKKDATIARLRAKIASLEATVKAQEDQLREMEDEGEDIQGGEAFLSDDDDFEEDEGTDVEDYEFLEAGADDFVPIDVDDE
ncbi:hypothetical protein QYE76_009456 [Lolium multiflorum]|uniref:Uncharacterized protein n=1 Tax=Lolium multiflorum TaxID=4521 RepID=A0AAD8TV17_LOLMU|nr:hypothetical protein QYE76_009456 [Lolium multiflorum]